MHAHSTVEWIVHQGKTQMSCTFSSWITLLEKAFEAKVMIQALTVNADFFVELVQMRTPVNTLCFHEG